MNFISLGLGRTAALLLTLGFANPVEPPAGNYITLGYAESAAKVVTLGLTPSAPVVVPPPDTGFGGTVGFPIIVPRHIRLLDDDEVFMWVIAAAASSGLLKG